MIGLEELEIETGKTMRTIRILFLGAGRRMSLFDRIAEACRAEGLQPELYSYEDSTNVPVAKLATIIVGLRWQDQKFEDHLAHVIAQHHVQVVIPCMDAASIVLSRMAESLQESDCWAVVSSVNNCIIFGNKRLTERWFLEHGVQIPILGTDSPFPWIVKDVHGFGSKNQFIVHDEHEFERLGLNLNDYLVQPFIKGPEFTVDGYVSRDGRVLGCVSRRRLRVLAGEVLNSITERKEALLTECSRILSQGGFQGPITLQAIEDSRGFWFIEANLRFGGGVILSIEAGADYAQLIVREAIGRPVNVVSWQEGVLMTRAYREVFHKGVRIWS